MLGAWAAKAGGGTVALLYGLPLCFTNMWLVAYTWLQVRVRVRVRVGVGVGVGVEG